ncbi:MAG: hypothetical protein ACXVBT_04970 [Flavisolibacter sp.]
MQKAITVFNIVSSTGQGAMLWLFSFFLAFLTKASPLPLILIVSASTLL